MSTSCLTSISIGLDDAEKETEEGQWCFYVTCDFTKDQSTLSQASFIITIDNIYFTWSSLIRYRRQGTIDNDKLSNLIAFSWKSTNKKCVGNDIRTRTGKRIKETRRSDPFFFNHASVTVMCRVLNFLPYTVTCNVFHNAIHAFTPFESRSRSGRFGSGM